MPEKNSSTCSFLLTMAPKERILRGNGTKRKDVEIGMSVQVIQKHHQATGELTSGIVKDILTGSAVHHRGIKVRLEGNIVGRISRPSAGGSQVQNFESTVTKELDQSPARPVITIADHLPQPSQHETIAPDHAKDACATWECKACTYDSNGIYSGECEICGTPQTL